MNQENEGPMRRKVWLQWVDMAMLGGGMLLALTVVILAMGASKWFLLLPIAGAVWLGWLVVQLRAAGENTIRDEEYREFD